MRAVRNRVFGAAMVATLVTVVGANSQTAWSGDDPVTVLTGSTADKLCNAGQPPQGTPPTSVTIGGSESWSVGTDPNDHLNDPVTQCVSGCSAKTASVPEDCPAYSSDYPWPAAQGSCGPPVPRVCNTGTTQWPMVKYPLDNAGEVSVGCNYSGTTEQGTCTFTWSRECTYDADSPETYMSDPVPDCVQGA